VVISKVNINWRFPNSSTIFFFFCALPPTVAPAAEVTGATICRGSGIRTMGGEDGFGVERVSSQSWVKEGQGEVPLSIFQCC